MKTKIFAIAGILIISIILLGRTGFDRSSEKTVRIGMITPLTGDVAFWGESSRAGAVLATEDLKKEGISIRLAVEDGGFDPSKAISAAQKLVNIDKANAVYSEFNPAAIAVNSFLKDKRDVLHLFVAAVTSPLAEKEESFKTYFDYEKNCREVAEVAMKKGLKSAGVLKINLEFGELCLKGIVKVFPDAQVEEYNAGDRDFRTQLAKLKKGEVDAVFNISFRAETFASIRNMKGLGMNQPLIGLTEVITSDDEKEYSDMLEGDIFFGFTTIQKDFSDRMNSRFGNIPNIQASAQTYVHVMQLGRALSKCGNDIKCASKELAESPASEINSFKGFKDRMSVYDIQIDEWSGGRLVKIK